MARPIKKEKEAMRKILALLKEVPPYELGSKLNLYEINVYYKMLRLGIIKENKKW